MHAYLNIKYFDHIEFVKKIWLNDILNKAEYSMDWWGNTIWVRFWKVSGGVVVDLSGITKKGGLVNITENTIILLIVFYCVHSFIYKRRKINTNCITTLIYIVYW